MKKIACLSALAAVLAFTAGTSVAATSTVTGGYAQSDAQGQMNKMGGFNLKQFDIDTLADLLIERYSIDEALAKKDAEAIASKWVEIGLAE